MLGNPWGPASSSALTWMRTHTHRYLAGPLTVLLPSHPSPSEGQPWQFWGLEAAPQGGRLWAEGFLSGFHFVHLENGQRR